jgi:hypothetical protein
MVGNINEGRLEFHQRIEGIKDRLHASPLEWWEHFEGYQCLPFGFFEIFGDFHGFGYWTAKLQIAKE